MKVKTNLDFDGNKGVGLAKGVDATDAVNVSQVRRIDTKDNYTYYLEGNAVTTQAKRYKVLTLYYAPFDWGSFPVIEVEIYNRYYTGGRRKFLITAGYSASASEPIIIETENFGGTENFQVSISPSQPTSWLAGTMNNARWCDIFIDVNYYTFFGATIRVSNNVVPNVDVLPTGGYNRVVVYPVPQVSDITFTANTYKNTYKGNEIITTANLNLISNRGNIFAYGCAGTGYILLGEFAGISLGGTCTLNIFGGNGYSSHPDEQAYTTAIIRNGNGNTADGTKNLSIVFTRYGNADTFKDIVAIPQTNVKGAAIKWNIYLYVRDCAGSSFFDAITGSNVVFTPSATLNTILATRPTHADEVVGVELLSIRSPVFLRDNPSKPFLSTDTNGKVIGTQLANGNATTANGTAIDIGGSMLSDIAINAPAGQKFGLAGAIFETIYNKIRIKADNIRARMSVLDAAGKAIIDIYVQASEAMMIATSNAKTAFMGISLNANSLQPEIIINTPGTAAAAAGSVLTLQDPAIGNVKWTAPSPNIQSAIATFTVTAAPQWNPTAITTPLDKMRILSVDLRCMNGNAGAPWIDAKSPLVVQNNNGTYPNGFGWYIYRSVPPFAALDVFYFQKEYLNPTYFPIGASVDIRVTYISMP